MATQSDLFEKTEDALLAERLMKTPIKDQIQGQYRTPEQYVNSLLVAEMLTGYVGARAVIEFCVTTLERNSGN